MILPSDICNRALDIIGVTTTIGDLEEGSVEARPFARNYVPAMQELQRAVNWNCLRRQSTLTLLQDATGQSPAPVGTGTVAMRPWVYEYAYPDDCMKARFVPLNYLSPSTPPPIPLTTANSLIPNYFVRLTPAPFLVSNESSSFHGAISNWNQLPDLDNAQGQGLISRTVILTNVPQATLVYTSRVVEPNVWDPAFQQALAAILASRVAMAVIPDRKLATAMQALAINAAKSAISDARISNGNEQIDNVDRVPDWIAARGSGGYWNLGYGGMGYLYGLNDSVSFPDGSVY